MASVIRIVIMGFTELLFFIINVLFSSAAKFGILAFSDQSVSGNTQFQSERSASLHVSKIYRQEFFLSIKGMDIISRNIIADDKKPNKSGYTPFLFGMP